MHQRRSSQRISPQLHLHRPKLQQQRSHLPCLPIHRALITPHSPSQSIPLPNKRQPRWQIIASRNRKLLTSSWPNKKRYDKIIERYSRTTFTQNKRCVVKNLIRILQTKKNNFITGIFSIISQQFPFACLNCIDYSLNQLLRTNHR